ncbi:hypothetical protein [Paracoccus sp. SY]|uniref:hypothetical protein n=1 Tax=Paracoccus sp. SY TaxID=1330255 RepID=UPI0011AF84F0|nr:hypothetical protein [Paracoccus sp. SY]
MADLTGIPLREPTGADVDAAVQLATEYGCQIGLRRELVQLLAAPGVDIDDYHDAIVEEAADAAEHALWYRLETDLAARRAETGPIRKPRRRRK